MKTDNLTHYWSDKAVKGTVVNPAFPQTIETTVDDNIRVLRVKTDMFCGNLFKLFLN